MDDETKDNLTPEEVTEEVETSATLEAEHREGEFDTLSAKLDAIITKLDSLSSSLADVTSIANAVSVDNGAAFTDDAGEDVEAGADVEIADTAEDPRERDYSIER